MTVLVLPEPCVVVLVGAAGSGKSTLAARLFEPPAILASDAFRAMISGDEADQRVSGAAFRALGRALERRLASGGRAVIDATNLRRADRRPWVAAARRLGVPAVAIVLDLAAGEVRRQGRQRQRVVADPVVDRHLHAMRALARRGPGALRDEGFDVVLRITSSAEAAALRLDPAPSGADGQPAEA